MKSLIYQNSTWNSCKSEKLGNMNVIGEFPIEFRKIIGGVIHCKINNLLNIGLIS